MLKIRNLKKNEGFTLIELMIVVAIIGILAAIAIPNFVKFQLRSKAGEGKLTLAGVRTAENAYAGEYGTYVDFAAVPAGLESGNKRAWTICPAALAAVTGEIGYCSIGYFPEGPTYFTYEVVTDVLMAALSPSMSASEYLAIANSDIDADMVLNEWAIEVPPTGAAAVVTAAPNLSCAGAAGSYVIDPYGNGVINQVGPCQPGHGINVF